MDLNLLENKMPEAIKYASNIITETSDFIEFAIALTDYMGTDFIPYCKSVYMMLVNSPEFSNIAFNYENLKKITSYIFRSIPVHLRELQVVAPFFRSIPVHFRRMLSDFPEYIRSAVHGIVSVYLRFRSISVHSFPGFSFLCAGKLTRNSTVMAGTTKDMSLIKQVLQLK